MRAADQLSFRWLIATYVRPFWKAMTGLISLTLLSNIFLVLQPVILAGILATVLGTVQEAPAATAGVLDLNTLGARLIHWVGLSAASPLAAALVLGGLYVASALAASGVDYAAFLAALRIRVKTSKLLQSDVLRHLLSLDLRFFHGQRSGELMSRLTQDAVNTAQGLGPLVRGVLHYGIQLIVYGLYLLSTSVWLTLGAAVVVALHFGLTQILKKPIRTLSRGVYDQKAGLSAALQETLTGIRLAKSFGAEAYEHAKLCGAVHRSAEANWRHGRIEKLEAPARAVLDAVGVIAIFLIAAVQLAAGKLSAQGLLLYVYVGRLVIAPANHMATNVLWVQSLLASFERLSELLGRRPKVVDGRVLKDRFESRLEVQGVSFAYGSVRALQDITLSVHKGERLALVGPSGSGKSTLAALILRLYEPDAGSILMDSVDLRELKQVPYRRLFGVVSQECLLFHDTVANNIRYGREEMTVRDLEEAARVANADDFIRDLPQGYDTMVGDRGVRLSGGQRQRIAIARAVAHRPQILILDEATSALDSESERLVQEAIERTAKEMTLVVIAHRLSTVQRADTIAVMEHGRIIDAGSHQELIERCGLYRHLWQLQAAPASAREPDAVSGFGGRR